MQIERKRDPEKGRYREKQKERDRERENLREKGASEFETEIGRKREKMRQTDREKDEERGRENFQRERGGKVITDDWDNERLTQTGHFNTDYIEQGLWGINSILNVRSNESDQYPSNVKS